MDSKKTILVVEDEKALNNVLTDVLHKEGFSVIIAENGKIGVEEAIRSHPDLILLDLLMPVMDGMEALREIRKDLWGAKVPVIILTNLSATDEKIVQNMVEGKPLYYLIKSDWKIYEVVEKIKKVLKM